MSSGTGKTDARSRPRTAAWRVKVIFAAALPCLSFAAELPPTFVDEAKAYLVRNFNEPESATYRALYIGTDPAGAPVLCGEVNARNARGGMSGFQAFYSRPGPGGSAKLATGPREFVEDRMLRKSYVDYTLAEADQCKRPGRPVPP